MTNAQKIQAFKRAHSNSAAMPFPQRLILLSELAHDLGGICWHGDDSPRCDQPYFELTGKTRRSTLRVRLYS
jgi:hypothetical protein